MLVAFHQNGQNGAFQNLLIPYSDSLVMPRLRCKNPHVVTADLWCPTLPPYEDWSCEGDRFFVGFVGVAWCPGVNSYGGGFLVGCTGISMGYSYITIITVTPWL